MNWRQTPSKTILWLLPALTASTVIFVAYLWTHPYPATGGGLYLAMAETIREAGYRIPARVPRYTTNGLPFAYPPLMFYTVALIQDVFGIGPLALTRFLPGLVTIMYTVPVYFFGRELFRDSPDQNRRAGVAAVVVAVSPAVFKWHLSAGGIVRAPAYLFTIVGLYVGVRLFRDQNWLWAIPGAVLFGTTILTHPSYPVFFATSYLVFYGYFDRSLAGLGRGGLVAGGGFLLAAPWFDHIITLHGIDIFTRTAGTRLGIGQGFRWVTSKFLYDHRTRFLAVWHILALIGVVHLATRRRYLLPLWFAVTVVMFPKPRFLMLVSAFVIAAVVFDWLAQFEVEQTPTDRIRGTRVLPLLLVGLLASYGVVAGGLYAANYEPIPERPLQQLQQEPLPSYVDNEDLTAMRWVRKQTAADATFLVAGDPAEWFPVFAERTVVASPWGAEWLPPDRREQQVELYRDSADCASAACLEQILTQTPTSPDYVYLTREGSRSWIARETLNSPEWNMLLQRVNQSSYADVAYTNRDVAILDVNQPISSKHENRTQDRTRERLQEWRRSTGNN